ncbi:hypothetical protein HK102_011935, partial [Quaeritorhiza haematococci]
MTRLANRSIDLLRVLSEEPVPITPYKQQRNLFEMIEPGYLFLSEEERSLEGYLRDAVLAAGNGAGPVRLNGTALQDPTPSLLSSLKTSALSTPSKVDLSSYHQHREGVDVLTDLEAIRQIAPPGISEGVKVAMHVRKAGYLNVGAL